MSGSCRRLPPRRTRRARAAATRLLAIAAIVIAALLVPLFVRGFVTFQLTLVMVYGLAILGLNLLDRVQRPVLARAQRVLRDRRLYRGDPDGPLGRAVLRDIAGGGRGVLCRRLPVRLPGIAAARHLSRAGDLRAGDRDAADPEIRPALAVYRRRAGDRDPEAGPAVRAADRRRPVALLFHAGGAAGHVLRRPRI